MLAAKYITGCLVAASVLLSCSKKESFDIEGDPDVKFFVNNTALGNAPQNSITYTVVNHPDAGGSGWVNLSSSIPASIKIPVFATREVGQDVVINAELDNSVVAAYNSEHGTSYAAFPEGFLNASALAARISKGAMVSADSLTIATDASKIGMFTGAAYMAPVKLTTVSADGAGKIATSQNIVYIVANVELRRIRFLATEADDLIGSMITDRSAWSVTFSPDPIMIGSVTDGATSSYMRWGVSAVQADVNIQESKNVTGIRLHTSSSSNSSPTQVQVYMSEDGVNYDHIGTPLRANLTFASGYTYILFYEPVPARYIRLVLGYSTSSSSQNRRLTELDVYAE